jgi:threonine synthase
MHLACSECGAGAAAGSLFCDACGGLLAFTLDPAAYDGAALRATFDERRRSNDPLDTSGVWRFRELLPAIAREHVVTLRENVLPVYDAPGAGAYADATNASYLHLGMNPTASFKDAGMTAAISHAKASGARVAVCASTGNTAAAMAAYAARAGITALVLVPAVGVSEAKMAQTLDYGATVAAIDGDFDRALEVVRGLDPARVAIVNSVNPYRIEGQKCAAFALLAARDWRVPDWLVLTGRESRQHECFRQRLSRSTRARIDRPFAANRRRASRGRRPVREPVARRRRTRDRYGAHDRDGDQDRRARVVAQGTGRSSRFEWHGTGGDRW